jgi:hypothetical protein
MFRIRVKLETYNVSKVAEDRGLVSGGKLFVAHSSIPVLVTGDCLCARLSTAYHVQY